MARLYDTLQRRAAASLASALAGTLAGGILLYLSGLFMLFGMGMSLNPGDQEMVLPYLGISALLISISLLTTKQIPARGRKLMLIPVALVLAGGIFCGTYVIPMGDYRFAESCMEQGDYERAKKLFGYLEGYLDSEERIMECDSYMTYEKAMSYMEDHPTIAYRYMAGLRGFPPAEAMLATPEYQAAREAYLSVGQCIRFGRIEQEETFGYLPSDPDPISWRILVREGDRALLLSELSLLQRPLSDVPGVTSWQDCSLRQWLNGEFLHTAFTPQEQTAILLTAVSNGLGGGYDTQDSVFLMSYEEICQYFPEQYQRKAETTERVAGYNNAYRSYLLRPSGAPVNGALCINRSGALDTTEETDPGMTVRPAMWVVLDPAVF